MSRRVQIVLAVAAVLALWGVGGVLAANGTWWPLIMMLALGGLLGIGGLGFVWYLRSMARTQMSDPNGRDSAHDLGPDPGTGVRPKRRRRNRGGQRNRG